MCIFPSFVVTSNACSLSHSLPLPLVIWKIQPTYILESSVFLRSPSNVSQGIRVSALVTNDVLCTVRWNWAVVYKLNKLSGCRRHRGTHAPVQLDPNRVSIIYINRINISPWLLKRQKRTLSELGRNKLNKMSLMNKMLVHVYSGLRST